MLYGLGCSGLIRPFRFRLAVYGLGLGFRVRGLGLGFRVYGLGFGVQGLGFGVQHVGFRVKGLRVRD